MTIRVTTRTKSAANTAWATRTPTHAMMHGIAASEHWQTIDRTTRLHESRRRLARMEAIDSSMDIGLEPLR